MAGKRRLKRFYDISLVVMVFSITLFGLLMLYSASSYTAERDNLGEMFYLKRQAFFAGFGFLVMLFTSRFIDYHIFAKLNNEMVNIDYASLTLQRSRKELLESISSIEQAEPNPL